MLLNVKSVGEQSWSELTKLCVRKQIWKTIWNIPRHGHHYASFFFEIESVQVYRNTSQRVKGYKWLKSFDKTD